MPSASHHTQDSCAPPKAGEITSEFTIAGVAVRIVTDDAGFPLEFSRVFGDQGADAQTVASLHARVVAGEPDVEGRLIVSGDDLSDPAGFLLQFASPTVPFVEMDGAPDERRIGLEGSTQPLFVFRGGEVSFAKHPRWRRIVAHFLFLRALRLRSDLLFFHAASVRVGDAGAMIIGPKGSGKTTLSLALAADGHTLLGDETAAFQPATSTLLPMLRPASIKPGVRAPKIDALLRNANFVPDEDGILHVRPDALFGESHAQQAPMRAVFFLQGIGEEASVEPVTPGRDELASMQPLRCSALAESSTRNVFAMIRLLNGVRCYRVRAGEPAATIKLMTEVLERP